MRVTNLLGCVGLLTLALCAGAAGLQAAKMVTITGPHRADSIEPPTVFRKPGPESLEDLRAMERHVKWVASRVNPAVVAVVLDGTTGSGIVVSEDGLVLTAAHVCAEPGRSARLIFGNGVTVNARTLGTDHGSDAGMIRITDAGRWPACPVNTNSLTQPGEWVIALGHPGGFEPDRPSVLRFGRVIGIGKDVIQSDCTISAGDSGGPLVDMTGRVVGIHSRISFQSEENYHVPTTSFTRVWDRLLKSEKWGDSPPISAASAGMDVEDAEGSLKVVRVSANGAAAKAGVELGDRLTGLEGQAIPSAAQFRERILGSRPGDTLKLKLLRNGEERELTLVLIARRRGGR